jgi:hypothetical protein
MDKISQQCTTTIGKLMQSNSKLLAYAITCWTEASYICSLTQLYQYFSAVKIVPSTSTLRPKVNVTYETVVVKLGKALADLISKKVLNAKQPLPAYILYRLGEFLERLSMVEWNESMDDTNSAESGTTGAISSEVGGLEAAVLRTMKKSPEGSSVVIAAILSRVSVDLSAFIRNGGASTALRIVKSPNADVRESGLKIIKSMAAKCADSVSFEGMVKVLTEVYIQMYVYLYVCMYMFMYIYMYMYVYK